MARGFIYVVTTLTRDYEQMSFKSVPTEWRDRLYFGPCKVSMRPKMHPGDWVFGISPSNGTTRRIVFAVELEERLTFGEAYDRFPDLRGPNGPIHVRPIDGIGRFPESSYEHISGGNHPDRWASDLASKGRDAFFVGCRRAKWCGRWLGQRGPEIDREILHFFKACEVHGRVGLLSARNSQATVSAPIRHGDLFTGLHLETDKAEALLALCQSRVPEIDRVARSPRHRRRGARGECNVRRGAPEPGSCQPDRVRKPKC